MFSLSINAIIYIIFILLLNGGDMQKIMFVLILYLTFLAKIDQHIR